MLLEDLFQQDSQLIDEALGKWGTLAALGAAGLTGLSALSGGGITSGGERLDLTPRAHAATMPQTGARGAAPARTTSTATPGVHTNFPAQLHNVSSMSPRDRVQAFQDTLVPLIQAENNHIRQDRSRARQIHTDRSASPQDRAWLQQKMDDYGASSYEDLMRRMDTVPVSLVLAQSAIESGWGSDHIARTANAFFGQRAVRDQSSTAGPQGERYRSYESPQHSIRSYMRNLNTHRAYSDFRSQRARLRQQGKTPTGVELAAGLSRYSTRGQDYVSQIQRLIRSRDFGRFDRS